MRSQSTLLKTFVQLSNLIGITAAAGIIYYSVPWAFIAYILSDNTSIQGLTNAMTVWANNLAANIPTVIALPFVVALTLGPDALKFLFGNGGNSSPPRI